MGLRRARLLAAAAAGALLLAATEAACGETCRAPDEEGLADDHLSLLQLGRESWRGAHREAAERPHGHHGGRDALRMVAATREAEEQPAAVQVRPHQGKAPDVVSFGIFCKDVYSVDFTHKTFQMDLVVTSKWTDVRTKKLVPKGGDSLAIPTAEAQSRLWLPDLGITNGEKGMETISSEVTVDNKGAVTKVDRLNAIIKASFDVTLFPFDTQDLAIRVASENLMSSDVVLKVLENSKDMQFSGVADHTSLSDGGAFRLVDFKTRVFEEDDGDLRKSRGEISINVKRDYWSSIESIVIPSYMIMLASILGFFIPVSMPPGIMPRVAMTFISFLAQVTLSGVAGRVQPVHGGRSWFDIWQEFTMLVVYSAVILNIMTIYAHFELKVEELPAQMDLEVRKLLAAIALFGGFVMFCFQGSTRVDLLSAIMRVSLFTSVFGYIYVHTRRLKQRKVPAPEGGGVEAKTSGSFARYFRLCT